jgi:hypothetical protein
VIRKSTHFQGFKRNYSYLCSVKSTDIYGINSALIQPVQCVTEYRLTLARHSADAARTPQFMLELQCRMPNTISTKNVPNTQCTMFFRSTCQSLNTSSYSQCCLYLQRLTLSTRIQTVRSSRAICHHPFSLHATHLSEPPFQQFVSCSALLSLLLLNLMLISLLRQL